MRTKHQLIISWVLIAGCGAAAAQAPPAAKPSPEIAPPVTADGSRGCTPSQRGTIAQEGSTTGQSREPFGDKLAKSDGVLCPPADVDPQMRAPTPNTGNTPVIPPPGSPGGDPTVRPK